MNPTRQPNPWDRLTAAARQLPDTRDTSAPYGFATRVAALAMTAPRPSLGIMMERFSFRALGVAVVLMLVSVAANYTALASAFTEETELRDPIAEVLDLGS
ncbi:MAG: hypothetical protein HZA31_13140 [Opitutae bacterium]|nr:hypothetical protein [Opitutae bacterium]